MLLRFKRTFQMRIHCSPTNKRSVEETLKCEDVRNISDVQNSKLSTTVRHCEQKIEINRRTPVCCEIDHAKNHQQDQPPAQTILKLHSNKIVKCKGDGRFQNSPKYQKKSMLKIRTSKCNPLRNKQEIFASCNQSAQNSNKKELDFQEGFLRKDTFKSKVARCRDSNSGTTPNNSIRKIMKITKPKTFPIICEINPERIISSASDLQSKEKLHFNTQHKWLRRTKLGNQPSYKNGIPEEYAEEPVSIDLKDTTGNNNCTIELQGVSDDESIDNEVDKMDNVQYTEYQVNEKDSNIKHTSNSSNTLSNKMMALHKKNSFCTVKDIYNSSSTDDASDSKC